MPRSKHPPTPEPFFWKNVNPLDRLIEDPDHCWLWQGLVSGHGYGRLPWRQMNFTAHRISYELHYGSFPSWLLVLHRCDTRLCCRPDHLFLGTHQDNVDDMIAKGHYRREPRGPSLRTHCKQGHEYTEENTYHHPVNGRLCRECTRIKTRRKKKERRAHKRAVKIIAKLAAGTLLEVVE